MEEKDARGMMMAVFLGKALTGYVQNAVAARNCLFGPEAPHGDDVKIVGMKQLQAYDRICFTMGAMSVGMLSPEQAILEVTKLSAGSGLDVSYVIEKIKSMPDHAEGEANKE